VAQWEEENKEEADNEWCYYMDGWATNQVKLFYYRNPPVVRVSHLCYNTILTGAKQCKKQTANTWL
jgi:hypothetical protein